MLRCHQNNTEHASSDFIIIVQWSVVLYVGQTYAHADFMEWRTAESESGEIPHLAMVQNYGFLFCCAFKHEPIGLFTIFVVLQREKQRLICIRLLGKLFCTQDNTYNLLKSPTHHTREEEYNEKKCKQKSTSRKSWIKIARSAVYI